MSRSGYSDDGDGNSWQYVRWRGMVASATRGKRGQAFFKDLLVALDEMPVKRLIAEELVVSGEFCTLGVLGAKRGIELSKINPDEPDEVSAAFDISSCLAQEVVFMNDDAWHDTTPEDRFIRMRKWVERQIIKVSDDMGDFK